MLGWKLFVQYQDKATEWDIGLWFWPHCFPVGQHYKAAMSAHCPQVDAHPEMTLDVVTASTRHQLA